MTRAKTIAFFALIGPAAAAVPFLLTILTLAAFHRDAQGIGIAVAALFVAYVYGLIPSAVSGWMFSWVVGRHPHVINRNVSVAQVGAVAGLILAVALTMLGDLDGAQRRLRRLFLVVGSLQVAF